MLGIPMFDLICTVLPWIIFIYVMFYLYLEVTSSYSNYKYHKFRIKKIGDIYHLYHRNILAPIYADFKNIKSPHLPEVIKIKKKLERKKAQKIEWIDEEDMPAELL